MSAPLLMTPGPCPVFPEVYQATSQEIVHHRTPEFVKTYLRATENMKKVFETKGQVFILTSSGTGAMEAAISNTVNPGGKVLSVSCGVFGSRFHKLAKTFGAKAEALEFDWGKGADPQKVKQAVEKFKPDTTTITMNETSTGVLNPIQEISELIRDETTILVDGISGIGGIKHEQDKWGIGISLAGSQKALGVQPGLSMVSVSDFMWERIDECKTQRFYFDLRQYRDKLEQRPPPFTPATSLVIGLDAALQKLLEIGLDKVYARQLKISEAMQAGVKELGLEFFAEEQYRSPVITSLNTPADAEPIRTTMNKKYNIMVAGGQKHLKGKILRIGHMGAVTDENIYYTLDSLKKSLEENGHKCPGDPVAPAKEILG